MARFGGRVVVVRGREVYRKINDMVGVNFSLGKTVYAKKRPKRSSIYLGVQCHI